MPLLILSGFERPPKYRKKYRGPAAAPPLLSPLSISRTFKIWRFVKPEPGHAEAAEDK